MRDGPDVTKEVDNATQAKILGHEDAFIEEDEPEATP